MPLEVISNPIVSQNKVPKQARDWQSLDLEIDGYTGTIIGVTSLTYTEQQDQALNYGKGVYPVSKGYGNVNVSGEMTLYVWQLDEILESVTTFSPDTKRPQNLKPFNIVVTWADRNTGGILKDTIYNCSIDTFSKSINQNDLDIQVTINLNPTGIRWNEVA